ncbi:acyl carrier protein [Streptomyces sp. MUM 203J]|uniref:acyl carrier protein n=1 Tax=Streptomyces sp. MUM 203J TaxID=2791990 RepID=UPI001F04DF71|nr:acyl carrier protein [Streptomyces sp. MUM 203J]MCH0542326.1 acyl carrier protein [Streptomyces sp. MUM 203J]
MTPTHTMEGGWDWDDWEDWDPEPGPPVAVDPPDPARLASAPLPERTRVIDRYVREELGRVLGVAPELIDTTGRPMRSLGIGSITGMELQHRMEAALHVEVNLQRLLLANSAAELIDCLAGQLGGDGHSHPYPAPAHTLPRHVGATATA